MAISSKAYKQILETVQRLITSGLIFTEDQVDGLDDIRKLYAKYKNDINYLSTYPRHGIKNAQLLADEILKTCKENGISYEFAVLQRAENWDTDEIKAYKVPWHMQDSQKYITFHKGNLEITELLVL